MQFRVLGPLEVADDGTDPVPVSAPKQRALLLLLLMHGGSAVTTDAIIEALWPGETPTDGVRAIRFHISRLRAALEPDVAGSSYQIIATRGGGYVVDLDGHDLDAARFESLTADGRSELERRPDRARRLLAEALNLWRGPAYADVAYEDFAAAEIRRLDELRLSATEYRITAELDLGRSSDLVAELEALVREHPLRERPAELLMRALYASGRSADAVVVARRLRERLGDIGLEPQPALAELEGQILRHEMLPPGHVQAVPEIAHEARLPTPLTSFIGRTVELQDVRSLIASGRLVTLVGAPGSGKTRLALAVATSLDRDYADGAVMVELSEVSDPDLVPQAVSTALGIVAPVTADYTELIVSTMRSRECLIVLDNCEHVLGKAARLVLSLLQACPHVKVLATSRETLGVPGERTWRVPPFALPTAEHVPAEDLLDVDSIRLFVDRARDVQPGFVADERNVHIIEAICRHLDALPLAIELAASTVDALAVEQIVERLSKRFVDVPSSARPGFAHQATMEDAVKWSYDLLSPTEQTVFNRLSVCAGGFTMDAAEAIAGWGEVDRSEVFNSVLRLVHKSLLSPQTGGSTHVRYRMLTVLRQFGSRLLRATGETDEVDRRHAEHYQSLAHSLSPHLRGAHEEQGREIADVELDNFRHALESSLTSGRVATAMRITADLTWYWYWRSYVNEGLGWARRALAAAPEDRSPERSRLLFACGIFEDVTGDYTAGSAAFAESYEIALEHQMSGVAAQALTGLGVTRRDQGRLAEALRHFEDSAEIDRGTGDQAHLGTTLRFLATVRMLLGRMAEAHVALDEAHDIFERLGHDGGMGWVLETACRIALRDGSGDIPELAKQARDHFSRIQDRRNDAWVLLRLAEALAHQGRLDEARVANEQSLGTFRELNDQRGVAYAVLGSGTLQLAAGDVAMAGTELRSANRLFADLGDAAGEATSHGYLVACAIETGRRTDAIDNAARWLAAPPHDRPVWAFQDVFETVVSAARRGEGADDLARLLDGYRDRLERGDILEAQRSLDAVPGILQRILAG